MFAAVAAAVGSAVSVWRTWNWRDELRLQQEANIAGATLPDVLAYLEELEGLLSPLRQQSGPWEDEIWARWERFEQIEAAFDKARLYAETYLDLATVAVFREIRQRTREIWANQTVWFSSGGGDGDPITARDPAMQDLWKNGFGSEAKKAVRALREQASEKLRTVARHGKKD